MKVSLLSNETNSQDPISIHSRIFVGNLNTFQCSKADVEQIFQRYGHLTAISMHKGYAFVQFSNPVEAKNAAEGENGRLVLNQNIDVNLVSEPKIHQQQQPQVTGKHVFQSSIIPHGSCGRHQSVATTTALKRSNSRFQHLLKNGAGGGGGLTDVSIVGGVTQPKLSVSIQKRRKRRRQHQLNRLVRSEFLLDSTAQHRMSSGSATNLMLVANHPFSGISPTLSWSSSSSASTSSHTSSIEATAVGSSTALSSSGVLTTSGLLQQQQVLGDYRTNGAATTANHNNQQQQQWYPGCYLSGLNINNNYLIPPPAYDNPNEVIDDGGGAVVPTTTTTTTQQHFAHQYQHHHHLPNPPTGPRPCLEEKTQEVIFYDDNNNPVSEFILTGNKSGPATGGCEDILICGNCKELFRDLGQLMEHRRTTCRLRLICECRDDRETGPAMTSTTSMNATMGENTVLLCQMCRKQFYNPMSLLQHVQHVHQIKIFETEHDYNPDKDLVTHGEQTRTSSNDDPDAVAAEPNLTPPTPQSSYTSSPSYSSSSTLSPFSMNF